MLPPLQPNNPLLTHTSEDMARLSETHNDLGQDQLEDEADTGKIFVDLRARTKKKQNCVPKQNNNEIPIYTLLCDIFFLILIIFFVHHTNLYIIVYINILSTKKYSIL